MFDTRLLGLLLMWASNCDAFVTLFLLPFRSVFIITATSADKLKGVLILPKRISLLSTFQCFCPALNHAY